MANEIQIIERDYGLYSSTYTEDNKINDDRCSLEVGGPGVDMLRSAAQFMLKATETRLKQEISGGGDLLQYGSVMGDPAYRMNLAKFLSEEYEDNVDWNTLMSTSGATAGLSLLASTFFNPGNYIFIEDPTFFQVNRIFRTDLGLNVVPIPLDEYGIDLKILEQEIELRKPNNFQPTAEYPFWALMYVIPVYQNPTGLCYSKERCEKIVKLARKHNLLVLCDDVYNSLCFEKKGDTFKRAPSRLLKYDVKSDEDYFGNVVSNGSFSKLLGPGLRLGWIEAPKVVLSKLMINGCLISGGSMNHYTSGIVGSSLNTDLFKAYMSTVRNSGKRKLDSVLDVLHKHCPKNVKYSIPKGGYFIWIELPSYVDVEKLNEICYDTQRVSFQLGHLCSTAGNFQNCLRICFMYYSHQELCKATKMLLNAIELQLEKESDNRLNGPSQ